MSELTVILGIIGFVVNILILAIGGTWKLSRVEAAISQAIADHKEEFEIRIGESERRIGETIAAVRNKIHEVETWARDEFVREGAFNVCMARLEKSVSEMGTRIETRLLRMENKIDKVKENGTS